MLAAKKLVAKRRATDQPTWKEFDVFKGLGNLTNMLKTAQQMGGRLESINEELKAKRISGAAGGGMVKVEVNGLGEVLKLEIEPSLIEKGEREMIEDLVPAAINQATAKAKQEHATAMKGLAEGIEIPGIADAISKFTGATTPPDE